MRYKVFSLENSTIDSYVLGPNISVGDIIQIPIHGGFWKAELLIPDAQNPLTDFCLVGEAVALGFDFHDFSNITESMVRDIEKLCRRRVLTSVLHNNLSEISGREAAYAEQFYEDVMD